MLPAREAYEITELIDAGDSLFTCREAPMRGRASAAEVGFKLWGVHTLRDGRIYRTQWFNERSEALEAAGLPEFDPEVEWSTLVEVYRGHAGARKAWESLKGTMQIRARYDDIRDLGESALALGEMKGTGQTTLLDFTGELAQLATYRRGKLRGTARAEPIRRVWWRSPPPASQRCSSRPWRPGGSPVRQGPRLAAGCG
jgi:hypothetical protein